MNTRLRLNKDMKSKSIQDSSDGTRKDVDSGQFSGSQNNAWREIDNLKN